MGELVPSNINIKVAFPFKSFILLCFSEPFHSQQPLVPFRCVVKSLSSQAGLATNGIFILLAFCIKLLIGLEGKSMTPLQGGL